jgi:hypothetical protein
MNEREAIEQAERDLEKNWKSIATDTGVVKVPLAEKAGEPLPDRPTKGGR